MNKKGTKIVSAASVLFLLLTGCNTAGTNVKGTGAEIPKFTVEAKELPESDGLKFVKGLKIGWNLGNTLDATISGSTETASETSWGNPATTEEMIKAVKSAGFNTIRVPVTWHNHVDKEYKIADEWIKRVKEVVDYGYKNGMYVILNIHHDTDKKYFFPTYDCLDNSKNYVKTIWQQVSEAFKDYNDHLIFESMNEPRLIGTDKEWWVDEKSEEAKEAIDCIVQTNQEFVNVVRASGGNNEKRYLMVPSYCASPTYACSDLFKLPDDPSNKIIVSVHAYEPYNFALSDQMNATKFDAERMGRQIDNVLDPIYEKYTSKGIPVVIGEFGSRNKGDNTESRVNHAGYYVAAARARGISCVWWDNNAFSGSGELFGLYDRNEGQWVYPDIVLALMDNC